MTSIWAKYNTEEDRNKRKTAIAAFGGDPRNVRARYSKQTKAAPSFSYEVIGKVKKCFFVKRNRDDRDNMAFEAAIKAMSTYKEDGIVMSAFAGSAITHIASSPESDVKRAFDLCRVEFIDVVVPGEEGKFLFTDTALPGWDGGYCLVTWCILFLSMFKNIGPNNFNIFVQRRLTALFRKALIDLRRKTSILFDLKQAQIIRSVLGGRHCLMCINGDFFLSNAVQQQTYMKEVCQYLLEIISW